MLSRFALYTAVVSALMTSSASADGWGTIKGKVVFADDKLPAEVKLDVNKDQPHCLSKGALLAEKWVIDPKSKGIRWVAVWIAPEKNGIADHTALPDIHPALKGIAKNSVEIDQPCCRFEDHLVIMRKGQEFVGRNSSPIAHNMLIQGQNGVNTNLSIPPGGKLPIAAEKWKPHYYPTSISCGIHPWMNAKMFVLGHPYYAVTNEKGEFEIKNVPAGNMRIIMWHDSGWAHKVDAGKKGFDGEAITVKDGETKTLEVKMKFKD